MCENFNKHDMHSESQRRARFCAPLPPHHEAGPGALSPSDVSAINTRLDALERMGQRYRDGLLTQGTFQKPSKVYSPASVHGGVLREVNRLHV